MAENEKDSEQDDQETEAPTIEDLTERLDRFEKRDLERTKALEDEKKASAGKDKKITELTGEKRDLQEASLDKNVLNDLRAEEIKQERAAWAEQSSVERLELEALRIEMDRRTVLDGLNGFPSKLAEYVKGTDKDAIETSARNLMAIIVEQRNIVDNSKKVTGVPKTGNSRTAIPVRANEMAAQPADVQREFGAEAEGDEFLKMVTEQQEQNK